MTEESKYYLRYAKLAHFKILRLRKLSDKYTPSKGIIFGVKIQGFFADLHPLKFIKRSVTRKSHFDDELQATIVLQKKNHFWRMFVQNSF